MIGLVRRAGAALRAPLDDHHRPYVDEVESRAPLRTATGAACGEPMRRVPEVIDVWFDSGAMPFAQHHSPFENEELFRDDFPADFICEALDQTRGWFYSLLAVSTLLVDRAPYRNVVCLGLMLDGEGRRCRSRKGNTVEPWQMLDSYGADACAGTSSPRSSRGTATASPTEAIGEGVRLFLQAAVERRTASTSSTPTRRRALAPAQADTPRGRRPRPLGAVAPGGHRRAVAERLDAYDATTAGRAIAEFVDDLSNWYVRRSRRRFWDGDPAAFATLRDVPADRRAAARPVLPVRRR